MTSFGQPTVPRRQAKHETVSSQSAEEGPRPRLVRSSDADLQIADVFLTMRDIERRYGIGRTRAYQLVKEAWFPKPVVEGSGRWSLASLRAAEEAKAASRVTEAVEPPRPKRRRQKGAL